MLWIDAQLPTGTSPPQPSHLQPPNPAGIGLVIPAKHLEASSQVSGKPPNMPLGLLIFGLKRSHLQKFILGRL
jgi:hypothetical protein